MRSREVGEGRNEERRGEADSREKRERRQMKMGLGKGRREEPDVGGECNLLVEERKGGEKGGARRR